MNESEALVGATIGGYRVEERVGEGGMGTVFRATHLRLGRVVALKLISPVWAQEPEYRARFEREASIAASIDHPNAVPIYEADEADGRLFIAMRFVEGVNLATLIDREGRLPPGLAVKLAAQVAAALDAAHERGLVHRDVKPTNVLVTGKAGEEHAYLTDFGIAKSISDESDLTRTGQVMGTVAYAAPEQLRGAPADGRVDVYSLGCLLFETLSGAPPFVRDSASATVAAHLLEPPPSLRAVRPEITDALDEVVGRALAKPPDHRYSTAGDLGRAAVAALDGVRVPDSELRLASRASTVPAQGTILATPRRKWRRPVIGVAVALLVAAGAVALFASVWDADGDDKPSPATRPTGPTRVVARVPVGREPKGIAALPGGVLVANEETGGEITRIDPQTNRVTGAPVRLGVGLQGLDVAGDRAWAWTTNGEVRPVDAVGKPGRAILVGPKTDVIWAVAGDRRELWVATSTLKFTAAEPRRRRSSLVRVDLRTNKATGRVHLAGPGEPFQVAVAADRGVAWAVQTGGRRLLKITSEGDRLVRTTIPLPDRPSGVAAGGDRVWVTLGPSTDARYANTVLRIDPRTNEIVGEPILVFRMPTLPHLDGEHLWLLSPIEGAVSKISTASGRVDGRPLRVGQEPSAMSVGNDAVWVTDRSSDTAVRIKP